MRATGEWWIVVFWQMPKAWTHFHSYGFVLYGGVKDASAYMRLLQRVMASKPASTANK